MTGRFAESPRLCPAEGCYVRRRGGVFMPKRQTPKEDTP